MLRFGSDLTLVALSGETCVDYSLRLKHEFKGPGALWVSQNLEFLLPVRLPVASAPEGAGWVLRAEAADFTAVDATPVRALSGDWATYHPRDGRNHALQSARIELSAASGRWELAATVRSDGPATASASTVWEAA